MPDTSHSPAYLERESRRFREAVSGTAGDNPDRPALTGRRTTCPGTSARCSASGASSSSSDLERHGDVAALAALAALGAVDRVLDSSVDEVD